jgi:phosphatidylinositol glycan class B
MKPFRPDITPVRALETSASGGWRARRIGLTLTLIFALGLAARLAMIPGAGIYRPDELFQYLEQAHRIVFGHGLVTWEYRDNIRSLLLPAILAGPMALGGALAPASSLYIFLPRACVATLSLSLVWTAWTFGARQSPRAGLIAAAIAAGWAEFVYMAPHILGEQISLALLLPAAALLTDDRAGPRWIAASGALLGLAVLLRIQHLPAAGIVALFTVWRRPRDWAPLLIGGGMALLLGAGVDAASGHVPFDWAIQYVRANIIAGRAALYGTAPSWAYAQAIIVSLGWWFVPLSALAAIGARRAPVLAITAFVNLAVHMAIGHKEYCFILLTTAFLILLAALGTGRLVDHAIARDPRRARLLPWLALALWGTMSASLAATGRPALFSMGDRSDPVPFATLRRDAGLCGVATFDRHFSEGGGYTYLHRAVPIYAYEKSETAMLARDAAGFNRIVAPATMPAPAGYRTAQCFAGAAGSPPTCIFARPGRCTPIDSPSEINRMLARTDQ